MDQADDNLLTALLTKRAQVKFRKIVNTCTERQAEKRIQWTVWILSHVLCITLCEHVNGLCPAEWLNEQSTKHWFRSVCTCPYSWATGRNTLCMKKEQLAFNFWYGQGGKKNFRNVGVKKTTPLKNYCKEKKFQMNWCYRGIHWDIVSNIFVPTWIFK